MFLSHGACAWAFLLIVERNEESEPSASYVEGDEVDCANAASLCFKLRLPGGILDNYELAASPDLEGRYVGMA